MEYLNLKQFLIGLGSDNLSKIYGKERLQTISNILDVSINENQIYSLLEKRYGNQILSEKIIRAYVIKYLTNKYINYLLNEQFLNNDDINLRDREILINTNWDRRTGSIKRLIEIFGLDENYLPKEIFHKPSTIEINPEFGLFNYQKRIKDKFLNNLRTNNKKMIINMPTGAGKTRTCFEGLVDYWRTQGTSKSFVLWIANTDELCEQALETLEQIWKIKGEKKLSIFRLWGEYKPTFNENNGGFIIASFKKLYSMMHAKDNAVFEIISTLKQNIKLIVVDEAHQSIANTYKQVLEYISNLHDTILVGLTATPGRGWDDQENVNLSNFYNNNLITLTDDDDNEIDDPVKFLQNKGYLSFVKTEQIKTEILIDLTDQEIKYLNNNLDLPEQFLYNLGENEERNLCIIAQIIKYYHQSKSILVFACSLDHASLLNEICSIKDIKSASIDKDTNIINRRKYIDDYKNKEIRVLFNYGVLTQGFDSPKTDVVIIARPTRSPVLYNQMIGRGIRGPKVGGNKECILVDIQDNINGMPNERGTFTMFRKYYSNST